MPHATLLKFGYPAMLVHEYASWCVLVRRSQATLGALVLVAKSEARSFPGIGAPAFAELHQVVADIESSLQKFRAFERINYLMLMMVDPHVHFHVLPRYSSTQHFGGVEFQDRGWPAAPDLARSPPLDDTQLDALSASLRSVWT